MTDKPSTPKGKYDPLVAAAREVLRRYTVEGLATSEDLMHQAHALAQLRHALHGLGLGAADSGR